MPIQLVQRAQTHMEAMRREFQLLVLGDPAAADGPPARLLHFSARFRATGEHPLVVTQQQLSDAAATGNNEIDLEFVVPADAVTAMLALRDEMAQADAWCRSGELLTLATPDDCVQLRGGFSTKSPTSSTGWHRSRGAWPGTC